MKTDLKIKILDWPNSECSESDLLFIQILKQRYNIIYSDEPDFLFFAPFGDKCLNYNCPRILISYENYRTNWNITDYAIDFDYLDFGDRHFRFPYFFNRKESFLNLNNRHQINPNRDRFCSYLVSANSKFSPRDEFFDLLSQYKKVDSGGQYRNNVGYLVGDRQNNFQTSKIEWLKNYKFNICFENTTYPGYLTEKLIDAFAAGCIPIYWGDTTLIYDKNISGTMRVDKDKLDYIINPKAYINVQNFKDFNEVIEYVKFIDSNDEAYFNMLKEPIFLNDFNLDDLYKKLSDFLFNIVSQDPKSALRRGIYHRNYDLRPKLHTRQKIIREIKRIFKWTKIV